MNKQLEDLYSRINTQGIQAIQEHQEEVDPHLLDLAHDGRRGLTLLAHLPAHVSRNISYALGEIKQVEPTQYYYPSSTMHLTIMDLRQAVTGFQITTSKLTAYCQLISAVTQQVGPIEWRLAGLIASPGAILVKGTYSAELASLRKKLRQTLENSELILDERYPTFSGHSTVVRYQQPIINSQLLLRDLADLRDVNFGSFTVSRVDLVIHDWYNRHSQLVKSFSLKSS